MEGITTPRAAACGTPYAGARLRQRHAAEDGFDDAMLCGAQRQRPLEHFDGTRPRHDDDAVEVTDDIVARSHADVTQADRFAHSLHLDAVLAGAHETAACVERIVGFVGFHGVAAHAVDHGAADAPMGRQLAEDAAPDGAVPASRVVEGDDGPGRHVVEVVAHGPRVGRVDGDRTVNAGPKQRLRPATWPMPRALPGRRKASSASEISAVLSSATAGGRSSGAGS